MMDLEQFNQTLLLLHQCNYLKLNGGRRSTGPRLPPIIQEKSHRMTFTVCHKKKPSKLKKLNFSRNSTCVIFLSHESQLSLKLMLRLLKLGSGSLLSKLTFFLLFLQVMHHLVLENQMDLLCQSPFVPLIRKLAKLPPLLYFTAHLTPFQSFAHCGKSPIFLKENSMSKMSLNGMTEEGQFQKLWCFNDHKIRIRLQKSLL